MTDDKPKDPPKAEASHVAQASFEERLRVASAQRAKVLAAKAAAEAEAEAAAEEKADVAPVRARRYIKPGLKTRQDQDALNALPDITSSGADEFAGSMDSFEARSERAADLLPRLADAPADMRMSKTSDDPGKLVSRLMLLSAFLVGAAAGCIGTIVWMEVVTLPGIL